jgi:hypothetical protein
MPRLRVLKVSGTGFSDKDVQYLRGLYTLREVDVEGCNVGDPFLATVSTLPRIRKLNLGYTKISERGVSLYLGNMLKLQYLSLVS